MADRVFRVGQRVKKSSLGIERLGDGTRYGHPPNTTGVVIGMHWHPTQVKIKPDNRKTASVFHVDFWEPE
jgi:hypothetical protein